MCDVNRETLKRLAQEFDLDESSCTESYDDLIARDVDIVVVATPIAFHRDQVVAALDAGKHVLSEQTQALTIAECQDIIDAEARSGKVYMMAENYTYFHYVQQWGERVRSGELGEITYAEADFIHEIAAALVDPVSGVRQWRYERAPIQYCAHSLGPILTILDDRITRASATYSGRRIFPEETGAGFWDMEVALFQTEQGRLIKVLASQVARRYRELVWFSIHGTEGFIENGREGGWGATQGLLFSKGMNSAAGADEIICDPFDPSAPPEAANGGYGTSAYQMLREFVEAVEGKRPSPIGAVRASDLTIPGIVAHQSAERGGVWLDVPLLAPR